MLYDREEIVKMAGKITKASDAHMKKAASRASKVLRNPRASKTAKSAAGSALSQRSQIDKGGAAYIIHDANTNVTVVTSSTSVKTIDEGTKKYRKVLSRLANK